MKSTAAINPSRKIRVLIVDDSASVRQMLTKILESDPEIEVTGVETPMSPSSASVRIHRM
jgi:two-component system chemotaxis response regulator CheB